MKEKGEWHNLIRWPFSKSLSTLLVIEFIQNFWQFWGDMINLNLLEEIKKK